MAFADHLRTERPQGTSYCVRIAGGASPYTYPVLRFERDTLPLTLSDWIPARDPRATDPLFLGSIDRSVDPVAFSGHRFDLAGMPLDAAILEGAHRLKLEGGRPDAAWLSASWKGCAPRVVRVPDRSLGPAYDIPCRFTDEVPEGECLLVQTDSWIAIEWPVTGERNLVCLAPRYNARLRVEAPAEHWSRV